jgi:glycosyltransferase involved in cell wall biosynthesis
LRQIELIIINDGSTDMCQEIIEEFERIDPRVLSISQKNCGVSAARNRGLELARGEYIAFVDSDDWIELDMLENLYVQAKQFDSDVVICNVLVHECQKSPYQRFNFTKFHFDLYTERELFFSQLMQFKFDNANWNKLYRRSIIHRNKLSFNFKMALWEDLLFNLQFCACADRVSLVNRSLYNYSIVGTGLNASAGLKMVNQFNLLYQEFRQYCENLKIIDILIVFKNEMVRSVNYILIEDVEKLILRESNGARERIRSYKTYLKSFDRRIFQIPVHDRWSWINVKSYMLSKGIVVLHLIQFGVLRSFSKTVN